MSDSAERSREVKLQRRSLRDELASMLDSTIGLEPANYDRDTLLMRLEAACLAWVIVGPLQAAKRERIGFEKGARAQRDAGLCDGCGGEVCDECKGTGLAPLVSAPERTEP